MKIRDKPAWMDLGVTPEPPKPPAPPPTTKPKVMLALEKIQAAGFTAGVRAGKLCVEPKERLTPAQVTWLATSEHKLTMTLQALEIQPVRSIIEQFDAEVMSYENNA